MSKKEYGLFKKERTIPERIRAFAKYVPDAGFLYYGNKKITWKEFDEDTNRFANALLDLGAKKGDNLAIMLYNSPEYLTTEYGCCKMGTLPVSGVNYRYTPKEIEYVLNMIDAKFLVLDEDFVDKIREIRPNLKKLENCIVVGKNVPNDMLSYDDLIRRYPKTEPVFDWEIKPEDDGIISMTGGTTGYPKGAIFTQEEYMLSSEEMLQIGISAIDRVLPTIDERTIVGLLKTAMPHLVPLSPLLARLMRVRDIDRLIESIPIRTIVVQLLGILMGRPFLPRYFTHDMKWIFPSAMFHGAAGYPLTLMTLGLGGGAVFLTKKIGFDPEEWCKTVERIKATMTILVGDAFAVPLLSYLDAHEGEYDISSLFFISNTGGILSVRSKKGLLKHMPQVIITDMAGSTEAMVYGGMLDAAGTKDRAEEMKFQSSVVGVMQKVRYINPETGKDLKPGEVGEVVISGHMARGYYGEPERSAKYFKTLDDGRKYFLIGDGVRVREDGGYDMLGRTSGIINTGGEKVYPEEVEDILHNHPKIAAVAITSVPDERWGRAVTAIIQLKPGEKATEDEIRDWCKERTAFYKVPKHVLIVPEVPLTPVGKIAKPISQEIANRWYEEKRLPTDEELREAYGKGKRI